MNKYFLSALVACAFIISSCADSQGPSGSSPRPMASDNAMTQGEYDWTGYFYNECCDEWIEATGQIHFAFKNGKAHYNPRGLTGTSSNGTTYRGGGAQHEKYDSDGAGGQIFSFSIVMTSAGGCHFTIHFKVHYHVDANGNIRVDKVTEEVYCND